MADTRSLSQQTTPTISSGSSPVILLTGVTGFLGKVVLEELVRRQAQGDIHFGKLLVLIRPARGKTPCERFQTKVVNSPCFDRLHKSWEKDIDVVPGDLMEASCGIQPNVLEDLTQKVTHIIHCAGCVSFDSSINVLLAENVTASLNILQIAQKCPGLQRLILTSTAYVTPHTSEPI